MTQSFPRTSNSELIPVMEPIHSELLTLPASLTIPASAQVMQLTPSLGATALLTYSDSRAIHLADAVTHCFATPKSGVTIAASGAAAATLNVVYL